MPTRPQQKPELSELLSFAKLGLHIFPCKLKDGKKIPAIDGWQEKATTNPTVIEQWYRKFPTGMWACATGIISGVAVVDVDVKHNKQGDITLARLMGGKVPKTLVVETPSGGFHYYFICTDPHLRNGKAEVLGSGLDLRANGGYVIIPPSNIKGVPYKWLTKPTQKAFNAMPVLPPELTPKRQPRKTAEPRVDLTVDQSKLNALHFMQNILPARSMSYDDWVEVLMCLHSVGNDSEIVNAALKFSRYSALHTDREFFDKWNNAFDDNKSGLTVGTLGHLAEQDCEVLDKMLGEAEVHLPLLSNERFTSNEGLKEIAKALLPLGQRGRNAFTKEVTSRYGNIPRKTCYAIFDAQTFAREDDTTMQTLKDMATSDSPDSASKAALKVPRRVQPLTKHYENVLEFLQIKITLNEMNDNLFINGKYMDDPEFAMLYSKLREFGLTDQQLTRTELLTIGAKHKFHPIRDVLQGLVWNGESNIQRFCERYVYNEDKLFPTLLRKTLIGAVRRVFFDEYTPMLVLESQKQGTGKSGFVRWLASIFPSGFATINPRRLDSTDELVKLCTYAIAEMPEIDNLPRDDQELVKNVLTMPRIQVRQAYARSRMDKPVVATIVGTLNFVGGFMSDPTGHRRFWPCSIEGFDWEAYTVLEDPAQLWAEAVYAVLQNDEQSTLDSQFQARMDELAARFKEVTLVDDFLMTYFELTNNSNDTMTSLEIINTIEMQGNHGMVGSQLKREVTRSLSAAKVMRIKRTTLTDKDGGRYHGYVWGGIKAKINPNQPFDGKVSAERLFNAKVKE